MSNETQVMNEATSILPAFIGKFQLSAMQDGLASEECKFFFEKVLALGKLFETMPKTYEQDGMGDQAVAHLHYFLGGMNWYITERDIEDEQLQAFGFADIGQGGELGYICIQELIENGVELDLHWTPISLKAIKDKSNT